MSGRICTDCDDDHLVDTDRLCPFCGAETRALDDYYEARWYSAQQDELSEPGPSMAALHRQAWEDREALRSGRAL